MNDINPIPVLSHSMAEFHSGAQAAYFIRNAVTLSRMKSAVGVPAWDAPHGMPRMECIRAKKLAMFAGRSTYE